MSVLVKVRMPFLKPASTCVEIVGMCPSLARLKASWACFSEERDCARSGRWAIAAERADCASPGAGARREIALDIEILSRRETHELFQGDPLLRVLAFGVDALALHRGEPHLGGENVVVGRRAGILALLGVLEMLLESGELLVEDLYLGSEEEGRIEDLGGLEGDARLDLVDADARGVDAGLGELDLEFALPEIIDELAGCGMEIQHILGANAAWRFPMGGGRGEGHPHLRPEVDVGGLGRDVGQVGALRLLLLGPRGRYARLGLENQRLVGYRLGDRVVETEGGRGSRSGDWRGCSRALRVRQPGRRREHGERQEFLEFHRIPHRISGIGVNR